MEYSSDGLNPSIRSPSPSSHYSITPRLQYSILLYFCFVNVTPTPVLARFEGLDHGVAGSVKMFSGVPIG